jgi:hypothetical protein
VTGVVQGDVSIAQTTQPQQQAASTQAGEQQQAQHASVADRVVQGVEALVNFQIADLKVDIAKGFLAAAPESGPGALAAGGAAGYLLASASGNVAAGGIQLVGAISGHTAEAGEAAKAVTVVTSGAGLAGLIKSHGNLQTAAKWAGREAILTTSPKELLQGKAVQVVAKVIDYIQSVRDAISH